MFVCTLWVTNLLSSKNRLLGRIPRLDLSTSSTNKRTCLHSKKNCSRQTKKRQDRATPPWIATLALHKNLTHQVSNVHTPYGIIISLSRYNRLSHKCITTYNNNRLSHKCITTYKTITGYHTSALQHTTCIHTYIHILYCCLVTHFHYKI